MYLLFLLFTHNVITESEVFQQIIAANIFILMTDILADILFIKIGQQMLFYDGFKNKAKENIRALCRISVELGNQRCAYLASTFLPDCQYQHISKL